MNQITEYIIQINCLNYDNQCKYIKKKLSSVAQVILAILYFLKSYM